MTRSMNNEHETMEAEAPSAVDRQMESGSVARRPTSLFATSGTLNTPTLTHAPAFPVVTEDTPTLVFTPSTLTALFGTSGLTPISGGLTPLTGGLTPQTSGLTPLTDGLIPLTGTLTGELNAATTLSSAILTNQFLANSANASTLISTPSASIAPSPAIEVEVSQSYDTMATQSHDTMTSQIGQFLPGPATNAAYSAGSSTEVRHHCDETDMVVHDLSLPLRSSQASDVIEQQTTRTISSIASDDMDDMCLDPNLAKVAADACITGKLTPLVKEELKYSIQTKRLRKGEGELQVEYKEHQPEKLSEEEEERRTRRRERNRIAAQKCRSRRKHKMQELEEETSQLMSDNSKLKKQIRMLQLEKDKLTLVMRCHDISDQCPSRSKLSSSDAPINTPSLDAPSTASSDRTFSSVFDDEDISTDSCDSMSGSYSSALSRSGASNYAKH